MACGCSQWCDTMCERVCESGKWVRQKSRGEEEVSRDQGGHGQGVSQYYSLLMGKLERTQQGRSLEWCDSSRRKKTADRLNCTRVPLVHIIYSVVAQHSSTANL